MIALDQALKIACAAAGPLGREMVSLADAHRRRLAPPVIAGIAAPPADSSAMDGYAVRAADLELLPASFEVIGESAAGRPWAGTVGPGQAVRISTGAAVPAGADWVVIQENCRRDGKELEVMERGSGNIRPRASDFDVGDEILAAGTLLGPRQLVAAAGADVATLSVHRQPRVALIGTGDELADPGRAANRPGAIPESLSYGLAAMIEELGAKLVSRERAGDRLETLEAAAARALSAADLVVVTGGASVGDHDLARPMFRGHGLELLFDKVAIKPGKPVWLGRCGKTLVLGLPGNPTSALVTARLFLGPLLDGLGGGDPEDRLHWRSIAAATAIPSTGARETLLRASLSAEGAAPIRSQDSSSQRGLAAADCLIRRPAGAPAAAPGEMVTILDF